MLVLVAATLAFLLFVLTRLAALQRQLDDAAAKIGDLHRALESLRQVAPPPPRPPAPEHTSPAAAVRPPAAVPPPVIVIPPPRRRSEPTADIEQQIGSRWMLIIGVFVLVLGVAFFVKYAFDNHWVDERARVAIGTAVGIGAWVAGLRFAAAGYVLYGHILAGGGLAIIYLAAFAAAALYAIVPATAAFGWMAIASGTTTITADRQRSQGLAVTAIVLAYAAPFLVGGQADHHVVLFVFYSLLAGAALALVRRHGWPALGPIAFCLTWIAFGLWCADRYVPRWYASTEMYLTAVTAAFVLMRRSYAARGIGFPSAPAFILATAPALYHSASVAVLFPHSMWLLVYFIAFTAVSIAFARDSSGLRLTAWAAVAVPFFWWTSNHVATTWYIATIVTATAIYVLHLTAQAHEIGRTDRTPSDAEIALFHANGLGLFGFIYLAVSWHSGSAAAVAFVLAVWNSVIAYSGRRQFVPLFVHALALAFAFTAIGISLELTGPWLTVAWAAEGFAVGWIGLALKNGRLRAGGAVLVALAVARLVLEFDVTFVGFTPVLNSRTAAGLFVVALMSGLAWLYRRSDVAEGRATATRWAVAANILTIALMTADITSYWRLGDADVRASFARELSISVAWGLYGMVLIAIGFRRRSTALRYLALALFGITVAKMFSVDLLELGGIYRITGFVVLGVVLLVASFLYQRQRAREQEYAGP